MKHYTILIAAMAAMTIFAATSSQADEGNEFEITQTLVMPPEVGRSGPGDIVVVTIRNTGPNDYAHVLVRCDFFNNNNNLGSGYLIFNNMKSSYNAHAMARSPNANILFSKTECHVYKTFRFDDAAARAEIASANAKQQGVSSQIRNEELIYGPFMSNPPAGRGNLDPDRETFTNHGASAEFARTIKEDYRSIPTEYRVMGYPEHIDTYRSPADIGQSEQTTGLSRTDFTGFSPLGSARLKETWLSLRAPPDGWMQRRGARL